MNSKPSSLATPLRRRIGPTLLTLLAPLTLALTMRAHAETQPPTIPFSDIGARATANYQGDALNVTATADGARLRCGFQKLEGHATPEGLWLESSKPGDAGRLRVTATALSRGDLSTLNPQPSTLLPTTGTVSVNDKLVRFTRPGLTEEYSVSVDGVRQDFIIESPPLNPQPLGSPMRSDGGSTLNQSMRVELALSGARAEATASGARLRFEGSGRTLAYSRLRVEDATGRELAARLEVLSADRLAVSVADANATYPVRIDPTFSDADWVSLSSLPGLNGSVSAIAVDGSGNVYIGGSFTGIGKVAANRVAKWDGSAWSALGSGLDGSMPSGTAAVSALAVGGTNLYAGGYFTTAGGVTANYIAKWDGSAWSALGSGMSAQVEALAVSGTDLYAGGNFTTAGGVQANYIAKWNGNVWSALSSGMDYWVYALVVRGADLYTGGRFTLAGGVTANCIAKWNGSAWSALGSGMDYAVHALAVSGTDLYAGGEFTTAGGVRANRIAKWDGSAWSALGSGMNSLVYALVVSGTDLYAGGDFTTAGGVTANYIAKWNGGSWSALGSGMDNAGYDTIVFALAVSGTNLCAGGYFTTAGGVPASYVAKWNGSAWSGWNSGVSTVVNYPVSALAVSGTDLYVGGYFYNVGGVTANGIAKWDGNAWSALGSGMGGGLNYVFALAVSGTNLYAGGCFDTAGGVTANCIAKWDGSAWSALGSGMTLQLGSQHACVYALAVSGTNLYAGGLFTTAGGVAAGSIAKWNGSAWSALDWGMDLNSYVNALAVSGTDLYAGGAFTTAGGLPANSIAKWNGNAWSALSSGMGGYYVYCGCPPDQRVYFPAYIGALAMMGSNLYAGGVFTNAGGVTVNNIAKWDGSAWSALGAGIDGEVYALAVSGTSLYAGGLLWTAGGVPASNIAKWNGSAWSALGSGVSGEVPIWGGSPEVRSLAADGAGHLFVGGNFSQAGSSVSFCIAQANVGSAPTILKPALIQTAEAGATVHLSVNAAGDAPLSYQWYFNGTNLLGCASSDLVLSNILLSQSGAYTMVAINEAGAVTSAPVLVNVIAPVERRPVPGVKLIAPVGTIWSLDYRDNPGPTANWETMATMSLTNASQFYFDLSAPLPPQRFYRAWQSGPPSVRPSLDLHLVPAITLTGTISHSVRVDYINQFGPIDAWVTLDTVTLTNTSQLYFDTSAPGQPARLYRFVPSP